jgi:hypothetical protein
MHGEFDGAVQLDTTPAFGLGEINPQKPAVTGRFQPNVQSLMFSSPLQMLVRKTLAEKLGFEAWYGGENADKLAQHGLHPELGKVSLSKLVAGFSYVGDTGQGEPLYEPIVMVGAVMYTKYPNLFPHQTPHDDNLTFTAMDEFPKNVRDRLVSSLINLEHNPLLEVEMCVHGLCLATSTEVSVDPMIDKHSGIKWLGGTFDDHFTQVVADGLAYDDRQAEWWVQRTREILGHEAFPQNNRIHEFGRMRQQGSNDERPETTDLSYP